MISFHFMEVEDPFHLLHDVTPVTVLCYRMTHDVYIIYVCVRTN